MPEITPTPTPTPVKPGWQSSEVQAGAVVAATGLVTAVTQLHGWQFVAALGVVSALVAVWMVTRTMIKSAGPALVLLALLLTGCTGQTCGWFATLAVVCTVGIVLGYLLNRTDGRRSLTKRDIEKAQAIEDAIRNRPSPPTERCICNGPDILARTMAHHRACPDFTFEDANWCAARWTGRLYPPPPQNVSRARLVAVLLFAGAGTALADEPAPPLSPPAAAAVAALRVDAAQAQLAALSRDTATAPVPVTPPTVAQRIEQVAMCAAGQLPAAISTCLGPKAPPPMDARTFWTALGAGLGANVTTVAGLIIAHYLPPVPMGQGL